MRSYTIERGYDSDNIADVLWTLRQTPTDAGVVYRNQPLHKVLASAAAIAGPEGAKVRVHHHMGEDWRYEVWTKADGRTEIIRA